MDPIEKTHPSGFKVLTFPASPPEPPATFATPVDEVLAGVEEIKDRITNVVVLASLDDKTVRVFSAVDDVIGVPAFIDLMKGRYLFTLNEYLDSGTPGPIPA